MDLTLDDVASAATAIAVLLLTYQLWQGRQQLRDSFERTFVERYETLIKDVDLTVILDGAALDGKDRDVERALFHYFELCEEELYYRAERRVSRATWRDWWYGMCSLLNNPAVQEVFEDMRRRAEESGTKRFRLLEAAYAYVDQPDYDPPRS